jgi:hypothetical protein
MSTGAEGAGVGVVCAGAGAGVVCAAAGETTSTVRIPTVCPAMVRVVIVLSKALPWTAEACEG